MPCIHIFIKHLINVNFCNFSVINALHYHNALHREENKQQIKKHIKNTDCGTWFTKRLFGRRRGSVACTTRRSI